MGKDKVMYALTDIRGVGRRFANLVCKRANVDLNKRAGELSEAELEAIKTVIENPENFNIPTWFLNRQKDRDTGKHFQLVSSSVDTSLRNDLERMKRNRVHRGLRHHWNIRVRGQHTKNNGRHGAHTSALKGK